MSQYHGGPINQILRGHLLEHSLNILHAPTFCIHVNQSFPHKDIKLAITFNDLLMNAPTIFKHNHVGTYIQQPHKNNKIWPHNFLLHLLK